MKLAVSMYSYVQAVQAGRLDVRSFIAEAKKAGADSVELLDFFYREADRDREAAQEELAAQGLPCAIFSVSNNFAKPDPADRAAQLERVRFGIGEAVFFGASVVRVFAGDVSEGITLDQARDWIVEGLAAASDEARARGVKLALENHGRMAGRGSQVVELVNRVRDRCGHDALGANPDTGNFVLVGDDPAAAVSQAAPFAFMAHLKDFVRQPGGRFVSEAGEQWEGCSLGDGAVQLGECLAELRASGFKGWLSVEYEGLENPFVAVPRSLAYARAL